MYQKPIEILLKSYHYKSLNKYFLKYSQGMNTGKKFIFCQGNLALGSRLFFLLPLTLRVAERLGFLAFYKGLKFGKFTPTC